MPSQTTLENDHFCNGDSGWKVNWFCQDDYVTMTKGLTSIEFGPGACEHHFKGHYSGEEVNADGYTIYCNTYTPTKESLYSEGKNNNVNTNKKYPSNPTGGGVLYFKMMQ